MVARPSLLLIFAVAFAFFIVAPPFLGQSLPVYPDLHWAEGLDLLTPLVLIPLYWLIFTDGGRVSRDLRLVIPFLVFAALWVEGQGMHLSANSINNLLGEGSTSVHRLSHFYDEVLSHLFWHVGMVGFAILLVATAGERLPSPARLPWGTVGLAAILYGFSFFAAIVEGGTVPIGLPAAIAIVAGLAVVRRRELQTHNVIAFFFWAHVVALLLFAVWGMWWGGFPQFSEKGMI